MTQQQQQFPMVFRINRTMEELGISRSTVNRFVRDGKLVKVQLGPNSCGITTASINSLLNRGQSGS